MLLCFKNYIIYISCLLIKVSFVFRLVCGFVAGGFRVPANSLLGFAGVQKRFIRGKLS